MTQVIVHIRVPDALAVRAGQPSASAAQIIALVREFGGQLTPMHPDAMDHLLVPYFSVEMRDRGTATNMIAELLRHPAVEAAYLVPSPELP